jgi:hypothetical protein
MQQFLILFMSWLMVNVPVVVDLLRELVPVLALCVAGYALHVVTRDNKGNHID